MLVCPVNSQNEEKLAGQGEARLHLLTNATYLAQVVDMHQFIWCQIARGIHCSTEHAEYHHCSTSRRGKEPSARFSSTSSTTTRTAWWSLCTLFLISDKVHIYSGEWRKTARIYLGLRVSPSVCSRSSSLSRNGGLALCRQLRSVCSHSGPTCQ